MLLPHRSNINMRFLSHLYTFTDITDCFCNSCVFNINLCVFDSLSTIRHERVSLVLTCCVTATFCATDVCAQKTVCQKFKLIWFKTHDFSVIYMIIKTKQMFLAEYLSCKGTALFWKRGRGAAAHLYLKRHARKQCVSASTQNRHLSGNYIINDLWGILSLNITDTLWGHLRLILHIVKRGIICLL